MPKIQYKEINFRGKSLELINLVNQVVEEYQAQGYELTLRQAYYQLVARGYIPNNERSYKNIGSLINDGRLAGLIDWYSITDRTRNLRRNGHWDNPADVIGSARYSYMLDKWQGQPNYVEVWVEKDALVDIVGQACRPLDTPYFSCRGYTSQSEMWSAAQRFIRQGDRENRFIIHLGDLGGWIEKEENLSHEGKAWVCGDAKVFSASHVLVIGAIGSRNDFTTFYRDKDNEITVKCGCFLGKIDRFLEKVTQTHGDSKYALVYRAAVEVAKLQIDLSGEAPKDADEE